MQYAIIIPPILSPADHGSWSEAILQVCKLVIAGRMDIVVYTEDMPRDHRAILGSCLGMLPQTYDRAFETGEGLLQVLMGGAHLASQVEFRPLPWADQEGEVVDPDFN